MVHIQGAAPIYRPPHEPGHYSAVAVASPPSEHPPPGVADSLRPPSSHRGVAEGVLPWGGVEEQERWKDGPMERPKPSELELGLERRSSGRGPLMELSSVAVAFVGLF